MSIKNLALGLGITTIASIASLSAVGNIDAVNQKININTSNISMASESLPDDFKYVKDRNNVYDPNASSEIMDKQMNPRESDFSDPVIRELFRQYKDAGNDVQNAGLEAVVVGNSRMFNYNGVDYVFTEGFSALYMEDTCAYFDYVLKATPKEYQCYIEDMKKYYNYDGDSGLGISFTSSDGRQNIYIEYDETNQIMIESTTSIF